MTDSTPTPHTMDQDPGHVLPRTFGADFAAVQVREICKKLQDEGITPPRWLIHADAAAERALQGDTSEDDAPEFTPTVESVTPPYAVFRCRYGISYTWAEASGARVVADDLLHNLAEQATRAEVREFLTTQQCSLLATHYAEALGGNVGTLRPIQFLSPTGLADVAMQSTVAFVYEPASGQLHIDWQAVPVLSIIGAPDVTGA